MSLLLHLYLKSAYLHDDEGADADGTTAPVHI